MITAPARKSQMTLLASDRGWHARASMQFLLEHPTLRLSIVRARGVKCAASADELLALMRAAEEAVRTDSSVFPEIVRAEVRNVLRAGGYKPTGRGKPASEFLLGAALNHGLPRVNNLVDINNFVSLKTALPISIFDSQRLGSDVSIRFGRVGEKYVFNNSGQEMDINGLPVVCRADEPVGNAVKDSMHTKVEAETQEVLAVIYGSRQLPSGYLERAAVQLEGLLAAFAGPTTSAIELVPD